MNNQDFKSCNETLLSSCNLFFNFDRNKLKGAKKEIRKKFEIWNKSSTRNRNGHRNEWQCEFPSRPVNKNTHIENNFDKEQLSSIYMIDDENTDEWASTGCLLIARIGEELDVLRNLQVDGAFVPTRQFDIKSFENWKKFGENSSPCTDIILVDQFVFSQIESEYEINSYSLLQELCAKIKNSKVNIIIFTLRGTTYNDKGGKKVYIPNNFISIERNLKSYLKEVSKVDANVTFVIIPEKTEHDRTIITNYKLFVSGDSFKYFNEKGDNVSLCTHGRWLFISSIFDKTNQLLISDFIEDLQEIINDLKNKLGTIRGDRKSLFLKFE